MSEKKRTYTRPMKVWTVMDAEGNERLVRAYTSADVLRHVTPQFVIAPATHDDIIADGRRRHGGDRGPARGRPGRRTPAPGLTD
jgi:hypothetical protein